MLCGQRGWKPARCILDVLYLITLEDGLDNLDMSYYVCDLNGIAIIPLTLTSSVSAAQCIAAQLLWSLLP